MPLLVAGAFCRILCMNREDELVVGLTERVNQPAHQIQRVVDVLRSFERQLLALDVEQQPLRLVRIHIGVRQVQQFLQERGGALHRLVGGLDLFAIGVR